MASEIRTPSPTSEITALAIAIETGDNAEIRIPALIDEIFQYISRLELTDRRCFFFANDLQKSGNALQNAEEGQIPILARKVQRAAAFLKRSLKPAAFCQAFTLAAVPQTDEALSKALQEKDLDAIRSRAEALDQIHDRQLLALFSFAKENWNLVLLKLILEKWSIPYEEIDALVKLAFDIECFEPISYPIILSYFPYLAPPQKQAVETWIRVTTGDLYQTIAANLAEIESIISPQQTGRFVVIDMVQTREELDRKIQRIIFPAIESGNEETPLGIAYSLWCFFLDEWTKGEAKPQDLNECLETILQTLQPAAPMKRASPSYDTFSSFQREEREEKFDPTVYIRDIQQAINTDSLDQLKSLLLSRNANHLREEDFAGMVGHCMENHHQCLGEVLSSPYFKLPEDRFMGILTEALFQQNWNALTYLLLSKSFERLQSTQVTYLFETFQSAKPEIRDLFNLRFAELD